MKPPRHIQVYGITDVGCVRSGNEDCYSVMVVGQAASELNPEGLLETRGETDLFTAVSDGMGGAAAGELASQTALTTLEAYLEGNAPHLTGSKPAELVNLLEEGVHEANRAIYRKAQEIAGSRGMGATLTATYLKNDILYLFQVGDSRAYILRENRFYQLTRDQSFVGHLVEMGTITEEQAMRHPQRNVILQALGTQDNLKVDISYIPLCNNDLVILCSDGLSGEFLPAQLQRLVGSSAQQDLGECLQVLVDEAKRAGGRDNITLIGIRVQSGLPDHEPGEVPRYMAFSNMDNDNPLRGSQSLFR